MVLELQGGGYAPVDWSPDDRTILLWQGVSVNESYLWLVDVARGQKTLLAPQPGSEPVAYRDAKFSRDGKDRKSTRLNSSHLVISYAVFCLKKKKTKNDTRITRV